MNAHASGAAAVDETPDSDRRGDAIHELASSGVRAIPSEPSVLEWPLADQPTVILRPRADPTLARPSENWSRSIEIGWLALAFLTVASIELGWLASLLAG